MVRVYCTIDLCPWVIIFVVQAVTSDVTIADVSCSSLHIVLYTIIATSYYCFHTVLYVATDVSYYCLHIVQVMATTIYC